MPVALRGRVIPPAIRATPRETDRLLRILATIEAMPPGPEQDRAAQEFFARRGESVFRE